VNKHRKTTEQHKPHKKSGMNAGPFIMQQFLIYMWHPSCYTGQ